MTDSAISLAAGFDTPAQSAWEELAAKALKGAPLSRLTQTTPDGVVMKPLYTGADTPELVPVPGLQAPRDSFLPWDIRQPVGLPDPLATNRIALDELERGVSSLELVVAGHHGTGLSVAGIATALDRVLVDLAPVALSGGGGLAAAEALAAVYRERGADPAEARPAFNLDPVSAWLQVGALPQAAEPMLADAAAFAVRMQSELPRSTVFRASGRAVHEAGASPAVELAIMLSAALAQLRSLEAAGITPEAGARTILLCLASDADVVPGIAKLRAARLLWARVLEASGVAPDGRIAQLQAITSRRMMARHDAWTNILRVTAATFAAATGGADVITALPLTAALGQASDQARRIARNTQIILMEESHLGKVVDPGAGAFAIEAMTRDLATAAWSRFQEIEAAGGIIAAVRQGLVQQMVGAARSQLETDVARRKLPLTGVSNQPLPGETPPAFEPEAPPEPVDHPAVDPVMPLPWIRLAEPFEVLRARGEAAGSPAVFFANLGPLSEFTARAGFARNLLSVAGLSAYGSEAVYPDLPGVLDGWRASGARCTVLCGTDARYAAEAAGAASALKAAGCGTIILAGKPSDEPALRAAGVDFFIHAGQDAVAALTDLLDALGA